MLTAYSIADANLCQISPYVLSLPLATKMVDIGIYCRWRHFIHVCFKAEICFVCLIGWGLSSHSRIFQSYWDVTITGEMLQILTYAQHSWPLSSDGSLVCHANCDTGHLGIMVISEDLWHIHLLTRAVTTGFYDLGIRGFDSNSQTFCLRGHGSNLLHSRRSAQCAKNMYHKYLNVLSPSKAIIYIVTWTAWH